MNIFCEIAAVQITLHTKFCFGSTDVKNICCGFQITYSKLCMSI